MKAYKARNLINKILNNSVLSFRLPQLVYIFLFINIAAVSHQRYKNLVLFLKKKRNHNLLTKYAAARRHTKKEVSRTADCDNMPYFLFQPCIYINVNKWALWNYDLKLWITVINLCSQTSKKSIFKSPKINVLN